MECSLVLLFFLFPLAVFAQDDHASFPAGSDSLIYAQIPAIEIPAIPFKQRSVAPRHDLIKDPLVAYNHTCSFTPAESGDWKTTGRYNTWFLKIRSRGAYGMALVFAHVKLLTGERLYIYNRHGIGGVYTKYNIPASGVLPLSFLQGDELLVEYRVPLHTRRGTFTIASVSHAYVDIFSKKDASSPGRQAHANRDKDCYACLDGDLIQLAKRSVVKILVHGEDGTRFCTGTLVNNTAEDKRPFVITAQHCIVNQDEADRSVFVFNYDDLCRNSIPVEIQQLQGASLRASSLEHDFTLVELDHHPPLGGRPYYAGWNLSERPATSVLSVHHPYGGPKKISLSAGSVVSGDFPGDNLRAPDAFWKIGRWEAGATETGSSGAPLFNHRYQLIGTLTGGSSSCSSPYDDYYEKLSSSSQASEILQWLDPLQSGVNELNGLDPFRDINPDCHSISNIDPNEFTGLEPHSSGEGYYSGYNGDQIASYAERFSASGSVLLTGASFSIGSINTNASGGVLFALHLPDDSDLPGAILHESFVPYQALSDLTGYIEFYPYVEIEGEFFVSYTLSYSPLDVFALNQAVWRNSSNNTAYVKMSSGWIPLNEVSPQNAGTSLSIRVSVCKDVPVLPAEEKLVIDFYPNPSSTIVICKPHFQLPEMYKLEVFDSQGRIQRGNHQIIDNNIVLQIADLRPGMYVARLTVANKTYTARVIRE